ncbi:MAG TPA: HBL/NHE enterotoxin family protein [Thermoanaerobaculia bacterium]
MQTALSLPVATSLNAAFSTTAGAIQVVDQAAQQILQLPTPPPDPAVPSLAQDVAQAKSQAGQWLNTLSPQARQIVQATIGFGGTFGAAYPQLSQLASQIAGGSTSAVTDFQSQLHTLMGQVTAIQQQVGNFEGPLGTFSSAIASDEGRFQTDAGEAQAQLSGLQGEMGRLSQELGQIQYEIQQEQSASGIALRILEDIFTLGLAELFNKQQQYQQQEQQLEQQLQQVQQAMQAAQGAIGIANLFAGAMSSLEAAMTSLANGWDQLAGDFNEIYVAAKPGSSFLQAALDGMKANWDDLLQTAEQLGGD